MTPWDVIRQHIEVSSNRGILLLLLLFALIGSLVSVLYFLSTGSPANLTQAVDGRGFAAAMTGTSVICGLLLLVTAVIVARAFRVRRIAAESVL